jgi:hypothetical protein
MCLIVVVMVSSRFGGPASGSGLLPPSPIRCQIAHPERRR